VLCHMYAQLGTDLLAKLKGDFAFVLYDAKLVRRRRPSTRGARATCKLAPLPIALCWIIRAHRCHLSASDSTALRSPHATRAACAQVRVFAACAAGGSHALLQARMPDGSLIIVSGPPAPADAPAAAVARATKPADAEAATAAAARPASAAPDAVEGGAGAVAGPPSATGAEGPHGGPRPPASPLLPPGCTAVQAIPAGWSKYGWQADPQPWARPQEDLQRGASQARPPRRCCEEVASLAVRNICTLHVAPRAVQQAQLCARRAAP